jgi:hypothetical protein
MSVLNLIIQTLLLRYAYLNVFVLWNQQEIVTSTIQHILCADLVSRFYVLKIIIYFTY